MKTLIFALILGVLSPLAMANTDYPYYSISEYGECRYHTMEDGKERMKAVDKPRCLQAKGAKIKFREFDYRACYLSVEINGSRTNLANRIPLAECARHIEEFSLTYDREKDTCHFTYLKNDEVKKVSVKTLSCWSKPGWRTKIVAKEGRFGSHYLKQGLTCIKMAISPSGSEHELDPKKFPVDPRECFNLHYAGTGANGRSCFAWDVKTGLPIYAGKDRVEADQKKCLVSFPKYYDEHWWKMTCRQTTFYVYKKEDKNEFAFSGRWKKESGQDHIGEELKGKACDRPLTITLEDNDRRRGTYPSYYVPYAQSRSAKAAVK